MAGFELCDGGTECAFIMQIMILVFNLNFQDNFNYFILDKYDQSEHLRAKWFNTLSNLPQGVLIYNIEDKQIDFKSHALHNIFAKQ